MLIDTDGESKYSLFGEVDEPIKYRLDITETKILHGVCSKDYPNVFIDSEGTIAFDSLGFYITGISIKTPYKTYKMKLDDIPVQYNLYYIPSDRILNTFGDYNNQKCKPNVVYNIDLSDSIWMQNDEIEWYDISSEIFDQLQEKYTWEMDELGIFHIESPEEFWESFFCRAFSSQISELDLLTSENYFDIISKVKVEYIESLDFYE